MSFREVLKAVFVWRVVLFLLAVVAGICIEYKPSFPYAQALLHPKGPLWVSSWGNFDGVHYLTIIEKGYVGTGSIQAFFPVYPYLVKIISFILPNEIISGIMISTLALAGALYYLSRLIALDESQKIANRTLWFILFFPTAFFFGSLYAESVFFFFVIMSLYWARRGNFLISAIMAGIASGTKVTGVLLAPAILWEYYEQYGNKKVTWSHIKTGAYGLLASSGLIAYVAYLKNVFNDPLLFLHVQSQFGAGRQTDKLIMIYQVFWRYIKMIIDVPKNSLTFYTVSLEATIGASFFVLCILAFWYTRKSYALFALLSFIVPTLTGTFTSLPRYVLILFPAFLVLAKITREKYKSLLLVIFGILLCINTMLFIQGYWIS